MKTRKYAKMMAIFLATVSAAGAGTKCYGG